MQWKFLSVFEPPHLYKRPSSSEVTTTPLALQLPGTQSDGFTLHLTEVPLSSQPTPLRTSTNESQLPAVSPYPHQHSKSQLYDPLKGLLQPPPNSLCPRQGKIRQRQCDLLWTNLQMRKRCSSLKLSKNVHSFLHVAEFS